MMLRKRRITRNAGQAALWAGALMVAACGKSSRNGAIEQGAGAGSGGTESTSTGGSGSFAGREAVGTAAGNGSLGGSSSGSAAGGASSGGGSTGGTAPEGDGGDGGEGGALPTDPHQGEVGCVDGTDARYRFCIVPALSVPGHAGEPGELGTRLYATSSDGSFILGEAEQRFLLPNGLYEFATRSFFWTPDSGTQPFPASTGWACVTPSGSAVFGFDRVGSRRKFYRWTPNGIRYLASDLEETATSARVSGCPGDVAVASVESANLAAAMLWRSTADDLGLLTVSSVPSQLDSGWTNALVSSDGSAIVVEVVDLKNLASDEDNASRYWRIGTGQPNLVQLTAPPGYESCSARAISSDGNVVVGACRAIGDLNGWRMFRWTEAGGVQLSAGPTRSFKMNDDASIIFGNETENRIARWTSQGVQTYDVPEAWVVGAAPDGSVAYVLSQNTQGDSGLGTRAYRWDAAGLTPVPALPGHQPTEVLAVSTDGSAALGNSAVATGLPRAVVWDRLVARDLLAELETAGINPKGMISVQPAARIFVQADRIRIIGWILTGTSLSQTWIAELPRL